MKRKRNAKRRVSRAQGEALFASPVSSQFKRGVNPDAHAAQINIFTLLKQHGGALFRGISPNRTPRPSGGEGR